LVVPENVEISHRIDTVTGDVVLTLIFKDQNGNSVVVTSTGDLDDVKPAVILEVAKVAPEVIGQIVVPPTPVTPTE